MEQLAPAPSSTCHPKTPPPNKGRSLIACSALEMRVMIPRIVLATSSLLEDAVPYVRRRPLAKAFTRLFQSRGNTGRFRPGFALYCAALYYIAKQRPSVCFADHRERSAWRQRSPSLTSSARGLLSLLLGPGEKQLPVGPENSTVAHNSDRPARNTAIRVARPQGYEYPLGTQLHHQLFRGWAHQRTVYRPPFRHRRVGTGLAIYLVLPFVQDGIWQRGVRCAINESCPRLLQATPYTRYTCGPVGTSSQISPRSSFDLGRSRSVCRVTGDAPALRCAVDPHLSLRRFTSQRVAYGWS